MVISNVSEAARIGPGAEYTWPSVSGQTWKPKMTATGGFVEDAFLDHLGGAALLVVGGRIGSRLENEFDPALHPVPEGVQDVGRPEGDGDVDVMAVGVHDAAIDRLERDIGQFLDGDGVHVGPEPDDRAGLGPSEQGDDSAFGDVGFDVEAEGGQPGGDDFRRFLLPSRQLGVHMNQPPDLDHFGLDFFDFAVDFGGGFLIDGGKRGRGAKKSKQKS